MTRPDPIPAGYGTVTPWIIGPNTDGLIRFLVAAFDGDAPDYPETLADQRQTSG